MKAVTILFFLLALGQYSCSTSKMVNQWKSPTTDVFEANKVLVIGMSSNQENRMAYEQKLVDIFNKKGVRAVKSIDFFEQSFTEAKQSENQLNEIEGQLLEAGFDAILFTTVTGSENKVTAVQSFKDIGNTLESFRDYYYSNQHVFYEEYTREIYQVYHTESALYCICPDKERELIWKGYIDIIDPQKIEKSVSDYVKVLMQELEQQQLLVVQ